MEDAKFKEQKHLCS